MNPGMHIDVLLRRTVAFNGGYLRASLATFSYENINGVSRDSKYCPEIK